MKKQNFKLFALLGFLLLTSVSLMAQNVTVRGAVIDASGEPLIGVTILVPGTTVGTITDVDGNFQLSVPDGSARLQFSFIGYQSVIEQIGSRTVINVRMREDAEMLNEVVVVGFGTQRRANLTGAVSTVDVARQLGGRPLPDLGRGLQGSVPGLSVTAPSGRLGAAPNFRIRGAVGSLIDMDNGSNPLILLDGAEISDISLVNPDDIADISVLKDAASASIYGARAAFGVILITTKRGQAGKDRFSVSYSNNFSWATPTVLPVPAKSYESAQMALDTSRRRNPAAAFYAYTNNLMVDDASIARMREWERAFGGQNLGPEMVLGRDFDIISGQVFFYRSFDPAAEYLRRFTPSQQHNISVSGSQGKTNIHLGIGYMGQGGVKKENPDKFERYSVNMNLDTRVNKYLTTRGRFMFSRTDLTTPFNLGTAAFGPYYQLYRWPAFMPYGTYQGHPFRNAVTESQAANSNTDTRDFMRVALGATVQFTRDLSLDLDYTFTTNNEMLIQRGGIVGGWDWWGSGSLVLNPNWAPVVNNRVEQRFSRNDHWVANAILRYNRIINQHRIGAFVGATAEENSVRWMSGRKLELLDFSKPEFGLAIGDMFINGNFFDWALLGGVARVNYSFADRYLLEMNMRADGSSRFPSNQLWGYFPSASVGWTFTEEDFMESLHPVLSFGKVRASWGTIGNQQVGLNRFRAVLPTHNSAGVLLTSGWIVNDINELTLHQPNALAGGFTWETIETINIGIDLRFFRNKLGLTADVFQRKNKGMISAGAEVSAFFGTSSTFAAPLTNNGELTTRGWELSADFRHTFANGLRIGVTAIVSDALATITRHANGPNTTLSGINYQGRIWGEIWGFETDGFFTEADFAYNPDGSRMFDERGFSVFAPGVACHRRIEEAVTLYQFRYQPGDIKYRDLVGNGVIDWGDNTSQNPGSMRRIGNTTPRYEYGSRISLGYQGFDFELFLQGVGKRDWWGTGSMIIPGWNFAELTYYAHQTDFWTPDNRNARYPRLTPVSQPNQHTRGAAANFMPQTKYLLDMSYLRVKNITLGYSLPASLLKRTNVERLRVYLSLENLLEFHNLGDIPIDPETNVDTGDGGVMGFGRVDPFTRSFSFGLQLRF